MEPYYIESAAEMLRELNGQAYFRPENGHLKATLVEKAINELEIEIIDGQLGSFDVAVDINTDDYDNEIILSYCVDHPEVNHSSEIPIAKLDEGAVKDLFGYLSRLIDERKPAENNAVKRIILRRKHNFANYDLQRASKKLGVSERWFKSTIPCTDYNYTEKEGKTQIKEYHWSVDLVERLCQIKSRSADGSDIQYIADHCCYGDLDWAKEIIKELRSSKRTV